LERNQQYFVGFGEQEIQLQSGMLFISAFTTKQGFVKAENFTIIDHTDFAKTVYNNLVAYTTYIKYSG
jgi:hypothetical protein